LAVLAIAYASLFGCSNKVFSNCERKLEVNEI
jgi:hypothetical protein